VDGCTSSKPLNPKMLQPHREEDCVENKLNGIIFLEVGSIGSYFKGVQHLLWEDIGKSFSHREEDFCGKMSSMGTHFSRNGVIWKLPNGVYHLL
jgi:hypothetical protein